MVLFVLDFEHVKKAELLPTLPAGKNQNKTHIKRSQK